MTIKTKKIMIATMTEEQRKQIALDIFNALEVAMAHLYSRWEDESQYEDIADYGAVIAQKLAAYDVTFVKMSKRPFGFILHISDAMYSYTIVKSAYSYKRIRIV